MTKWEKIKEGYGLQKVPPEIAKDICCCYGCCATGNFPTVHLYTDQSLSYDSIASYSRMVEKVRGSSYCRMHAEKYFGD